ncbi:MAG: iron export ABC transporter permease subunit FetB [Verrucomicrobiaceae bacterium]|nr:iron export ABC transporter permease subunit FetB [Verrucomicrobiaceae bacterium]
MNIIELEPWELALAGALVVALASCTIMAGLGVAKPLLIAAVRMVLQLSLIGLVLRELLDANNPWWVGMIALVMLAFAGREVSARQKYRLRGIWGYGIGTGAMFVSSFAVSIFGLAAIVRADPWWDPRYAIPVLGMLLGNTMTAVALSIDRLTASAWQSRETIEARLMLGESGRQAVSELVREALRSGLIPVINSMAVAGVVSLPGMMTGQILAGNPPGEAVRYQILIWLLIAAGCGFGMLIAVRMTADRLFDERDRLRLDRFCH